MAHPREVIRPDRIRTVPESFSWIDREFLHGGFLSLEDTFRERFFELMLRREKVRPETVERMRVWEHSGFNIDFARRIDAEDRTDLEGLLSYMERAPVSLRRLNYRPDGLVHYQGTKLHPRLGIDHQLCSPVEFLALLIPHVLLKYQITLRCYGAVSTTFRRKLGWIEHPPVDKSPPTCLPAAEILPLESPQPKPSLPLDRPSGPPSPRLASADDQDSDSTGKRKRDWAKLISKVWHEDPSLCKSCGQPMKIIAAITSPEQDDVIERILRHLNLWDPPWLRQRKARGPPPSSSSHSPPGARPEIIDPPLDLDQYLVDPTPDDD